MNLTRHPALLPLLGWFCMLAAAVAVAQKADVPSAEARLESEKLYMRMHEVLGHPRCVNCHPKDDTPRQGSAGRVHVPPIARGPKGEGPAGLQCAACHQEKNDAASGVPGAPHWQLAPRSMAWQGLSAGELCRALVDRSRNGNRSIEATVKHLTSDALVAWGWAPGNDPSGNPREPVPVARDEFAKTVQAWARLGAACPR
jgi:hypothetical protein